MLISTYWIYEIDMLNRQKYTAHIILTRSYNCDPPTFFVEATRSRHNHVLTSSGISESYKDA